MGIMIPKRLAYLSGVGLDPDTAFAKTLGFVKDYEAKAVIIDSMGLAMQGDMDKGKEVLAFRRSGAAPALPYALIHPSAWKRNSPKFAPSVLGWHHWRGRTTARGRRVGKGGQGRACRQRRRVRLSCTGDGRKDEALHD